MKYNICLIIITILSLIYNALVITAKDYSKNETYNEEKIKLYIWEKISTFLVMSILLGIIFIVYYKMLFNLLIFIYFIILFLLYLSALLNVLLKKKQEKISRKELSYISIIPIYFSILLSTEIWKKISLVINNLMKNNIVYFIIKENTKSFICIFFITILLFLIILEINKRIHFNNNKPMQYLYFDENKYIYSNARGKKGKKFLIAYIKDIIILIKNKFISIWQRIYVCSFRYIFKVSFKFLKNLTQNFSLYVIIMKTFSISLIISLIYTYYKLLVFYKDNIVTDFYSIIITTIIIPIVLDIISDLKKS